MDSFIISLRRAETRWSNIERQFAALGLVAQRVEAVDGCNLTDNERHLVNHRARRRYSPYSLSDNEIACWLSHRLAMATFLASDAAMAAVLEDDALLDPAFPTALETMEHISHSFDFIFLHRNHKAGERFLPVDHLFGDYFVGRVGYSSMKATGYVVSRSGAEKFLALAPPFIHAVDAAMHRYWENGLDVYGLSRPVVVEDPRACSYIDETRMHDAPASRPRYPDADSLSFRATRRLTKLGDSVQKRIAFMAHRQCLRDWHRPPKNSG